MITRVRNISFLSPLVPLNHDNLVCLSLYIFWGQYHLCLLLQNTFVCKSKHRWLCPQKISKLRQTKLSQFVYFSLVLGKWEETNTKHSVPICTLAVMDWSLSLIFFIGLENWCRGGFAVVKIYIATHNSISKAYIFFLVFQICYAVTRCTLAVMDWYFSLVFS